MLPSVLQVRPDVALLCTTGIPPRWRGRPARPVIEEGQARLYKSRLHFDADGTVRVLCPREAEIAMMLNHSLQIAPLRGRLAPAGAETAGDASAQARPEARG